MCLPLSLYKLLATRLVRHEVDGLGLAGRVRVRLRLENQEHLALKNLQLVNLLARVVRRLQPRKAALPALLRVDDGDADQLHALSDTGGICSLEGDDLVEASHLK